MEKKHELDKLVFWPAIIVIFSIAIIMAIFPESSGRVVNGMLGWITFKLDWFFEYANFFFLVFALWLAFGRFGKVKLGRADDKPEFSTLSWVAMMFCTGIGSSLIYWGVIEPLQYMAGPPFGLAPNSAEAAEWGVAYGMFHWGIMGWIPSIIPAVAVGYAYHVKNIGTLRVSEACFPVIGDRSKGWLGKVIDIFVIFGVMGACSTSLGVGVPMLSRGASELFNIPETFVLQVVILLIWVCIYGFSVYSGLYKGIKRLSDINVYFAFAILAFVLLVGPTAFILSNTCNSLGLMFQNFIRMCLYTDPISQSGFPQGWTVFFYAWWIAYASLIGLFVARVSRGRTLKEIVLAVAIYASLGDWLVFGVFGSYAIHLQNNGILNLVEILNTQGGAAAIIATVAALPLGKIVLAFFIVLQFVFMATTLDSASFVMASISTKELRGYEQPERWIRVIWALALGSLAFGVLVIGGLKAIQICSIVGALPFIFVEFILALSIVKWLKEDLEPESVYSLSSSKSYESTIGVETPIIANAKEDTV